MQSAVAEGAFDRYARMTRRALDVPTAIVTLVESERQVLVGLDGLGSPWAETRETPLTHSVCQYVVRDCAPLVIADTGRADLLVGNLALPELGVAAYAGWPLHDNFGRVVGALAAIDSVPRAWSADELEALSDLASVCSSEMSERLRRTAAVVDLEESERFGERARVLLALSESLSAPRSLEEIAASVNRVAAAQLGCIRAGTWLLPDLADAAEVVDLSEVAGRTLEWVRAAGAAVVWPSAARMHQLPVAADNPVGAALVGGEPVFCVDHADQDARFPAVVDPESVGEGRAFLPLVLGARPLGVLVLVWPDVQDFDAEQRVTLAALGAYTAQAVQRAALIEERVSVSITLQRAMLTELPRMEGVELAARYLPAASREQVGGDWYDAVALVGGDLVVAVGDVTGHDIVAATLMSQLRSMLRAIVTIADDAPSRSLSLLDRVVGRVGLETIASALLVRMSPPGASPGHDESWRLTWSRAGHLPALLVDPRGRAELLEAGRGSLDAPDDDGLIGLGEGHRHDHVRDVEPGSVLLLYTDGLVERRGELLDRGLERLCVAVHDHLAPLDELIDGVLHAQLGTTPPDDDVAVLAVRLG